MIEEELPLSYGNSANGCGDSSVSLFPSQKQPKPSRSPRMKRSRTPTPPPVTQMSLSEIDSLISPLIRHRAGEFVESEIKLMIEEIGKRRHILLSTSSEYNNGLKKKAWEEVALNVALRYPKGPKRSGIQVMKKWSYLASRTKRMIKAGHLNQEMQFNEITALVMELLASASQDMRQSEQVRTMELADEASLLETQQHHTGDSCGGSTGTDIQIIKPSLNPKSDNLENFRNGIVPAAEIFVSSSAVGGSVGVAKAANSTNCENDIGDASSRSDVLIIDDTSIDGPNGSGDSEIVTLGSHQKPRSERARKNDLLQQSRNEHGLRMEILQLQRHYWQLKIDAFLQKNYHFVDANQIQQERH